MEENEKSIFYQRWFQGAAVLALVLLSVFLFAESLLVFKRYSFAGTELFPARTIVAEGRGEAFAAPDAARITFTVEEEGKTPEEAQTRATEKMDGILSFLQELGLEKDAIKTVRYQLSPRYAPVGRARCVRFPCPQSKQEIVGYALAQGVEVTVSLEKDGVVGELLAGLGERGVRELNGPFFEVKDDVVPRDEARERAIAAARERAKVLAAQLGVRLGRLVAFQESGIPRPVPQAEFARAAARTESTAAGAAAPLLPAGETRFVSQVELVYEMR